MACKERYNPWLCFPNYLISAFCFFFFQSVFSLGKIWDRNPKVSQSTQYIELGSVIWFLRLSSLRLCSWCWYLGTGVEDVICIFPPCQQCALSGLRTWFLQLPEKGWAHRVMEWLVFVWWWWSSQVEVPSLLSHTCQVPLPCCITLERWCLRGPRPQQCYTPSLWLMKAGKVPVFVLIDWKKVSCILLAYPISTPNPLRSTFSNPHPHQSLR